MMKNVFYIVISALLLAACTTDTTCRQDMQVQMGVQLEGDSLRLNADSTAYEHVTFSMMKQVTVTGVGAAEPIVDRSTVSSLNLHLHPAQDECSYVFTYQGLSDTLHLLYTRQEQFVSLACGCAVFATLDTAYVGGHFLDSVQILNTAVTTAKEKHLKIFFHQIQTLN